MTYNEPLCNSDTFIWAGEIIEQMKNAMRHTLEWLSGLRCVKEQIFLQGRFSAGQKWQSSFTSFIHHDTIFFFPVTDVGTYMACFEITGSRNENENQKQEKPEM